MGSKSDWETMTHAAQMLESLGVPFEVRVVSAHRTPDLLFEYAGSAEARGLEVIIAGAGGAAHLPGMAAAKTNLPVLSHMLFTYLFNKCCFYLKPQQRNLILFVMVKLFLSILIPVNFKNICF